MDSSQHNDAKERAAAYQVAAALREVESGNREQARAKANAAVKLAPNRDVRAIAALALARAGDTAGAEKLAAELDKTFPTEHASPKVLDAHNPGRCRLGTQRPEPGNRTIEGRRARSNSVCQIATYSPYLCARSIYGEKPISCCTTATAAAAEFQKFIDHRGVVVNFPWGALARLGLARAYAMQGDTAKAKAAYQDFLTLWKDADPDIPILIAAKAEYAKLK